MSQFHVELWLLLVMLVEVPAIFAGLLLISSDRMPKVDKWLLTGVIVFGVGCAAQIIRTLHFFKYGFYPVDHYFPLWALKDFGFSLFVLRFCFLYKAKK